MISQTEVKTANWQSKEQQLVAFNIGNQEFGIDISQVREIVRLSQITYLPKAPVFIEGVVNLRGQVLAVIDLAKKLGVQSKERGDHSRIIIVEAGGNTVGMIVDAVSEVLRLSSLSTEAVPSLYDSAVPEHYIKGIGKLKDRLLVFLDLNTILSSAEVQRLESALRSVPA